MDLPLSSPTPISAKALRKQGLRQLSVIGLASDAPKHEMSGLDCANIDNPAGLGRALAVEMRPIFVGVYTQFVDYRIMNFLNPRHFHR